MMKRVNSLGSFFKKAQGGGAAALILVIALVLVLYIALIPTEDRVEIIGGDLTNTGNSNTNGNTINNGDYDKTSFSFNGPGLVDDTEEGREIVLPSVNLKTRTNTKIISDDNTFHITNSFLGDGKTKLSSFSIRDLDDVENIYMSFIVKKSKGFLKIKLNDFPLYENEIETTNIKPIKISSAILKENNILEFSVSDVGLAFWRTNEYIIDDFKVYGDITERSQQSSLIGFELEPSEYKFLKRAKLRFFPDCDPRTIDRLSITVNGETIYSQVPDCSIVNIYDLPLMTLKNGLNSLEFKTSSDSYIIDRITIETDLTENDELIYYFDLDEDLFVIENEEEAVCGEYDGVCIDDCNADDDIDCCFVEYTNAFWCDVPTLNDNDRCVGRVDNFNVGRCDSGYEDDRGRPAEVAEDMCGDDTDGVCPLGCSKFYDKDCCFENNDYYWCDDIPTNGFGGICVATVTQDSCSFCPEGYEGENRDPTCSGYESRNPVDEESKLKSGIDLEIALRFVDDNARKRGSIRINGYEISFDTYKDEVIKDISRFVVDGNNYAQILPDNDFKLVNIDIDVK